MNDYSDLFFSYFHTIHINISEHHMLFTIHQLIFIKILLINAFLIM